MIKAVQMIPTQVVSLSLDDRHAQVITKGDVSVKVAAFNVSITDTGIDVLDSAGVSQERIRFDQVGLAHR